MQKSNGENRLFNWEKVLLYIILLATFILSVKQLYPLNSFDEAEMMNWSKDLETDLFPGFKFPPLFLYLHYFLSLLYRGVLSFLGIIGSTKDFLGTEWGYRFTVEAGRVVSAIFGTLTVYFTYRIGKEFYSKATGFAAALLLACNPLYILYSHIFRPDILVALLMTVSFYILLKYLRTAGMSCIFWASFFYGLAVAGKFNVFPVVLAIVAAIFLTGKKEDKNTTGPIKKRSIAKVFQFIPLGAAAGFFAGAPNWLINPIGNINKFFMQYSPGEGNIYLPYDIKSPLGTYTDIASDLIGYFGLVFFVLLMVGILVGFLTRDKNDMVISTSIISYFLLFGFFGFYASRYGLPPYPAMALLMAKVLMVDLKKFYRYLSERRPHQPQVQKVWRYVAAVLWIFIGAHAVYHTIVNVKNYNLLKTQLSWERAIEYRETHNILNSRFNVGRQIFTPKIPKRNIKLTKHFYLKNKISDKSKTLHFIQAHRETYGRYLRDKQWQADPRTLNMADHRPFYRIMKPQYQPWHPESIFLYLLPAALRDIAPPQREDPASEPFIPLPRPFYRASHTNYLPLQVYEKNPNFIKMDGQYLRHWLYSKKKLDKIILRFFTLQKKTGFTVSVNGTRKTVEKDTSSAITRVEIDNIQPKKLYHDYVYDLQFGTSDKRPLRKPFYFVMEPVYRQAGIAGITDKGQLQKASISLDVPVEGEIPQLFSGEKYPAWVISVYQKTGIDLSLLTFVRTQHLYTNPGQEVEDISVDFFPLEKGHYHIRFEVEKIIQEYPFGDTVSLEYETWGTAGKNTNHLEPDGQIPPPLPLEVTEALIFTRINIKGLRSNNYFIKRVSIVPDFRSSLKNH